MGNSNKEKRNLEHDTREQLTGSNNTIGNQQKTAQTGAQNGGGENIDREDDQYTEDLRQSGDRNSSNRKSGS
jgi:hypothetical protein